MADVKAGMTATSIRADGVTTRAVDTTDTGLFTTLIHVYTQTDDTRRQTYRPHTDHTHTQIDTLTQLFFH